MKYKFLEIFCIEGTSPRSILNHKDMIFIFNMDFSACLIIEFLKYLNIDIEDIKNYILENFDNLENMKHSLYCFCYPFREITEEELFYFHLKYGKEKCNILLSTIKE